MWSYPAYIIFDGSHFGGFLFLFLMKKSDLLPLRLDYFNHFIHCRDELKFWMEIFSFRKKGRNISGPLSVAQPQRSGSLWTGITVSVFLNKIGSGCSSFCPILMHPLSKENILARQGSIQELAIDPTWSQHLLALQGDAPVTDHMQSMLDHWIVQHKSEQIKPWVKIIRWILPMLSLSSVLLRWTHIISAEQFILFAILVLGIQGYIAKVTESI